MTEEHFEILSPILDRLAEQDRINMIETIAFNERIIKNYRDKKDRVSAKNMNQSHLFNPLTFFSINEPKHSFLIAKLLEPNAEHGQGKLFLKSFLKLLDIEINSTDNWIVTAETGRIDILLKRNDPHSVVIIENKSNNAPDQENQLYRYWYREIFLPNQNRFGTKAIVEVEKNKNYRVIYLSPDESKKPSEYSTTRPVYYETSLPEVIPSSSTETWIFKDQIVNWLQNSIKELSTENHRLREYLKQYIELWTSKI